MLQKKPKQTAISKALITEYYTQIISRQAKILGVSKYFFMFIIAWNTRKIKLQREFASIS